MEQAQKQGNVKGVFQMKNTKTNLAKIRSILTILAIALVFGMTACSNGGGGGSAPPPPPSDPTSTVYESTNGSDTYILEITSSATGNNRAAYNPKDGDDYNLTIIQISDPKTSKGKVKTNPNGFALTPNGSTTSFTVSISNDRMNKIEGTIKTDKGDLQAPGQVIPTVVTTPGKFELLAEYWGSDDGDSSEEWTNAIDLDKFTSYIPKKGDVLRFKVSGTTDKPLVWLNASIGNYVGDGQSPGSYKWLGGTEEHVSVSGAFEQTFDIHIYNNKDPNLPKLEVGLGNTLWRKDSSGNYTVDTGLTLPPGYEKLKTVMATISNFSIRLTGVRMNLE
jgi:hypothetical protein